MTFLPQSQRKPFAQHFGIGPVRGCQNFRRPTPIEISFAVNERTISVGLRRMLDTLAGRSKLRSLPVICTCFVSSLLIDDGRILTAPSYRIWYPRRPLDGRGRVKGHYA